MSHKLSAIALLLAGLIPATSHASPESFKPVLPLTLTWTSASIGDGLKNGGDLFQSKAASEKSKSAFKESLAKLSKKMAPTDQAKELATLRQAAAKLGPKAKLIADLTSAQVTSGLNASGTRHGPPSGNWRSYLLAACNTASKIDEATHEKTAIQAVTLWRRVEGPSASWTSPPLDIKAQKQFKFVNAITERQALDEWSKGQDAPALKKYRVLARSMSGTGDGAALDLRLIEMEKSIYNRQDINSKQVRRWQKVLLDTSKKYEDQHLLGDGNEAKVQRVSSTVAVIHKNLIHSLIAATLQAKSQEVLRNQTLEAIGLYLGTKITDAEKEPIRAGKGTIQFNGGQHKAAAETFSALATETQGAKSTGYWREAIRSQTILASWPVEVPWGGFGNGDLAHRESLIDMYKKLEGTTSYDWAVAGHVGLLMISNSRAEDAYKLWIDRLQKSGGGQHPSHAAGWMVSSYAAAKRWGDLETLGRIMVKNNLTGTHLKATFKPKDVLGLSLLEGGLEALSSNDFKKSIAKLEEYVKGWAGNPRHNEGMYHLALAYQGNKQYRTAVLALENFVELYPTSKWYHDALVNGGNWTMGLTWDEHVIFFLEAQIKTFPGDEKTLASMQTLADLYMGREIYDSALRIMSIQIASKSIDQGTRIDIARRMLDTAERYGSPASAVQLSSRLNSTYKNDAVIAAMTLSVKARISAAAGNISGLSAIEKITSRMDQSQPQIADIVSEVKFLVAQAFAKDKFKDEVYSLGSKNPGQELENGYALYTKIDQAYKSACLSVRTSWCGPALHRAAAVGDLFVKAYSDLTVPQNLDPDVVSVFSARKEAIVDTVNNLTLESDEKSVAQARAGATNPDWTASILLQASDDASAESFTRETANHYIQWHTH
jgi:TolA-binding protein